MTVANKSGSWASALRAAQPTAFGRQASQEKPPTQAGGKVAYGQDTPEASVRAYGIGVSSALLYGGGPQAAFWREV